MLLVLAAWATLSPHAHAAPGGATRVKVRGATHIAAHTRRGRAPDRDADPRRPARPDTASTRVVFVEGTLDDDVGNRLGGERVEIRAFGASDGRKVRLDEATTCDAAALPLPRGEGDAVVTTADTSAARFCARLVLPIDRYRITLASPGSALMDPGALELTTDLVRRSVALRFDGATRRVSLDKDEHTFIAVASYEDEDLRVPAENLPLTLTTKSGAALGREVTVAGGQATFHVKSALLGEPGMDAIIASFPGDESAASATESFVVEKRARAILTLARPVDPTSAPEDGVPLEIVVSSRASGPPPAGAVEVRARDIAYGAAPVRDGKASFAVSFPAPERGDATFSVLFKPEAPWWDAPDALTVKVPIVGTPPWRKIPLLLAGVFVIVFVALGRIGRIRSQPKATKTSRTLPPFREGVEVVEIARDGKSGWTGRIVDAHDRSVVRGARVLIELADFQGTEVLTSAFGDDEGGFALPAVRSSGRAQLVVDAPHHASLRKPLPPQGVLEIALTSRRRALLDRLVEWARIKGKPYDARPEPTPAHVRRASAQGSGPARWADAVESAAFGPEPVDGRVEQEVDALKPDEPKSGQLPVGQTKEA